MDCLFCKIVKGEIPSHKVWEDEKHLAFLTIFPNTPGFTVVITKDHYDSYVFDLPEDILKDLVIASKKVGKLIDSKFEDVGRTGMIFEDSASIMRMRNFFQCMGQKVRIGNNAYLMSINILKTTKDIFPPMIINGRTMQC